jgi:iron complex outermembrane receptor protein
MHLYTIYKKVFLLFVLGFSFFSVNAQNVMVTGKVRDDKGEPVIQAVILVPGTQLGTVTDYNGSFSLEAPQNGSIMITNIGYDTFRTTVQSEINVTLHGSTNTLKEAVVIGYGSVGKDQLTGSVAKVDEKDFQDGTITTPEGLIAGKVAGVSITSNGGSPGSGSNINIRGITSINGNTQPLFIIDGLPINQDDNIYGVSSPLSLINPDDIESFTILKDGAATAIYGSRASAGVVIITTKKGKKGKPVFSFSTRTSIATVSKEQDVMSAQAFRNYVSKSQYADSPVNGTTFKALLGNSNTNWQNEIFRPAVTTDDNFNVSGAVKNLPYRVSVSYLDQQGLLKTDDMKRYSGAVSLSPSFLHDDLKVTINVKGSVEDTRFANGSALSSAVYFDPTQAIKSAGSPYGGYFEWSSGGVYNKLAPRNPVALLNLYDNESTVYRSLGNAQLDYRFPFLPELHANLNVGYDLSNSSGLTYVPSYAAQNWLDSGQHNPYANQTMNTVSEFYLTYNKMIPSIKSNINATAGYGFYNYLETDHNYATYRANLDTVPGSKPVYNTAQPQNSLLSYYARLIYTFNVKYILAASVREDLSSKFPNEGSSGVMPSVAFTWRINKEGFLYDSKVLSQLNLRASYGVTGNQAGIGNYIYQPNYGSSINSSLVQMGSQYYNPATPVGYNSNIQWEQTHATNVGIDFGFFNNRISGSVEVYDKQTTGLLNSLILPAGTNFTNSIIGNVGNMSNKGVEFTLNVTPVKTQRFQWDIGFNVSYNQNKITKLTNSNDSSFAGNEYGNTVQINSVGNSVGAFYVYHQEYDKNGKPIEGVYQDVNGDGVINQKDLYEDHSPFPNFVYGFTTRLSFDKWTLSTVLRANTGNYMYNSIAEAATTSNVFNPLGYLANTSTALLATNFRNGQPNSDYYVQDASFLKMDNLTLAYNIGKVWHGKLGISVNVYCQNVFTVTKYSGIDPEIYGGYDAALYPRPRIYGIGANIKF